MKESCTFHLVGFIKFICGDFGGFYCVENLDYFNRDIKSLNFSSDSGLGLVKVWSGGNGLLRE